MRSGVSTVGDPKLEHGRPALGGRGAELLDRGRRHARRAQLGDYKGLEVGKRAARGPRGGGRGRGRPPARVASRGSRASTAPPRHGDHLVMDFTGRVDGEAVRGRRGPRLHARARRRPSDRGLRGAARRRTRRARSARSRSPSRTSTSAEELQGREAAFEVQVKDVKEKQLPELDDDFASEASEFDTLDELRADIAPQARARPGAHDRGRVPRGRASTPRSREADARHPGRARDGARARRCGSAPSGMLRAPGHRPGGLRAGARAARAEEMIEEAKDDARQALAPRERARGGRRGGGHRDLRRGPARGAPGDGRARGHRSREAARAAAGERARRPDPRASCGCARRSTRSPTAPSRSSRARRRRASRSGRPRSRAARKAPRSFGRRAQAIRPGSRADARARARSRAGRITGFATELPA